MTRTVLIIGSAPDAIGILEYGNSTFTAIIAINNAWRIRPDWTHLVHAGDFPDDRKPDTRRGRCILSHEAYVPANNAYGGIVYAGGTMAFSTAYWALHTFRPDIMSFCGCDMIYDGANGQNHFYGKGRADPLRSDPTLQSLEAKATRLMLLAAREGCLCLNLSQLPKSRLTFPRLSRRDLTRDLTLVHAEEIRSLGKRLDRATMAHALFQESVQGLFVPSGDYWNYPDLVDPSALAKIDQLWLSSFQREPTPQLEFTAD